MGKPREFTSGDKEEQEIAEACNRLVKNAVVCWNYLLLEHRLSQAPSNEAKAEIRAAVANHSVISWAARLPKHAAKFAMTWHCAWGDRGVFGWVSQPLAARFAWRAAAARYGPEGPTARKRTLRKRFFPENVASDRRIRRFSGFWRYYCVHVNAHYIGFRSFVLHAIKRGVSAGDDIACNTRLASDFGRISWLMPTKISGRRYHP